MWPQASIHFYKMLIEKTNSQITNCRNQDYPNIILSNIPVPDLIASEDDINFTVEMVNKEAKVLEKSWATHLVMPCNTMHLFQREILKWIKAPFISMIDCVVKKIRKDWYTKIWLIWSSTTMQSQLYIWPLNRTGISTIIPESKQHSIISDIIQRYISWTLQKNDIIFMKEICDKFISKWCQAILLWCTELPLIMESLMDDYDMILSSDILVQSILEHYHET